MNSVLTLLILVAVPWGSSANGDADDHEICGELGLKMTMAVTNAHKDEHVVEGIEEGLATYLGISKSYVHIKFAGADAHAGHGHRRLKGEEHIADYNITFPSTGHANHSAVTAVVNLLKSTKASAAHTKVLISNITAKVVAAIAEAKAAGETITLSIDGGELETTPSTGHVCHVAHTTAAPAATAATAATTGATTGALASGSTMLSCCLGFLVLLGAAMF